MTCPPALAAAIMGEHVIVEEVNNLARLINLLLILRILDADVMHASIPPSAFYAYLEYRHLSPQLSQLRIISSPKERLISSICGIQRDKHMMRQAGLGGFG